MKRSGLAALGLMVLAAGARAEQFAVDTDHAEIGFTVRHLMLSDVKGNFNTFEGTIDYDMTGQTLVSFEGSIQASSIDTNNQKHDDHLRNQDFFNVTAHPEIKFKSVSVVKTGDSVYQVTGTLTVLGVERDIELPVTVTGPIEDPWGKKRIGLACTTDLNRRDLGLTHSPAAVIGDQVSIHISAEAVLKTESK